MSKSLDHVTPLTVSTNEVRKLLGISRNSLYALIRDGLIRTVQFAPGGKHRILRTELERFLEERMGVTASVDPE